MSRDSLSVPCSVDHCEGGIYFLRLPSVSLVASDVEAFGRWMGRGERGSAGIWADQGPGWRRGQGTRPGLPPEYWGLSTGF